MIRENRDLKAKVLNFNRNGLSPKQFVKQYECVELLKVC